MSQATVFELLGIAGMSIGVVAYAPQVVHLARQHCSGGVSGRAWAMWLTSSLLIGALALHRHDPVFIALQAGSLTTASVILLLTHRYAGWSARLMRTCARTTHAGGAGPAIKTASSLLLRDRKPAFAEVPAQVLAGVMQGLVESAAAGLEALGEDVHRHAIYGHCDEHAPLMRRQGLDDRRQ